MYIGVTSNLLKRVYEHKNKAVKGFTSEYNLSMLVYFKSCGQVDDAIARERQLKNWHRDLKLNLVKRHNPQFRDLAGEILKRVQDDDMAHGHRSAGQLPC